MRYFKLIKRRKPLPKTPGEQYQAFSIKINWKKEAVLFFSICALVRMTKLLKMK